MQTVSICEEEVIEILNASNSCIGRLPRKGREMTKWLFAKNSIT